MTKAIQVAAAWNAEFANAYTASMLRAYAKLLRYEPELDAAYASSPLRLPDNQVDGWLAWAGVQSCKHWRNR